MPSAVSGVFAADGGLLSGLVLHEEFTPAKEARLLRGSCPGVLTIRSRSGGELAQAQKPRATRFFWCGTGVGVLHRALRRAGIDGLHAPQSRRRIDCWLYLPTLRLPADLDAGTLVDIALHGLEGILTRIFTS